MRRLRLAHFLILAKHGGIIMPDYKTMYYKLFSAVTDAIEILTQAQLESENLYLDSCEKAKNKVIKLKILDNNEKLND